MKQLEKKLQEAVSRYNEINKYAIKLNEQVQPPVPAVPPTEELPPAPDEEAPVEDIPADDSGAAGIAGADDQSGVAGMEDPAVGGGEVPPTEPATDDSTEEMDITDLVNLTKNIKQELENSKDDNGVTEKMDGIFSKLGELEQKLAEMDNIISKIDELGSKVEQMKPKTEVEKLEMRSLDSYPFNEKPQEFFAKKQDDMRASGKNEYVLTKSDVENYNKENIRNSFNDMLDGSNEISNYR